MRRVPLMGTSRASSNLESSCDALNLNESYQITAGGQRVQVVREVVSHCSSVVSFQTSVVSISEDDVYRITSFDCIRVMAEGLRSMLRTTAHLAATYAMRTDPSDVMVHGWKDNSGTLGPCGCTTVHGEFHIGCGRQVGWRPS